MTLKIFHGDWYYTVIEGNSAVYPETALQARACAKARGYRFQKVEHIDGRAVETWRKK